MQRFNDSTPKAVQDCHELLEWLIPHLDKFPRTRRFTLGERIESGLLEVLERLIEAAYSRSKTESLRQANLKLDVVRHLWRLSYRLQAIPLKRYEYGSRLLLELGQQIGGWRRQSEKRGGRSSNRNRNNRDEANNNLGFRLARPPDPKARAGSSKELPGVPAGVHGVVSSAPQG